MSPLLNGENIVLRLMKCLPPTVMNNSFTSFCLLTHLGVNNIWATGVFIKNRLRKCTSVGDKQPQKKECGQFEQSTSTKKVVQLWQWLVWTTWERCTLLFLNFLNLRDLFGVWTKLKESIFKNNSKLIPLLQREHGLFRQDGPERFQVQDWYPNEKVVVVAVCLNGRCCFSECVGLVSY